MRLIIAIITVISGLQLVAFGQRTDNFKKSYEDSIVANHQRRSFSGEQPHLERRLGLGLVFKALKSVGTAIAHSIHNHSHKQRRSYDELLEERDQLLEIRNYLHNSHGYLAKRSDSFVNDIVKRLAIHKREVDYLLKLNARDLVKRDVGTSIADLD